LNFSVFNGDSSPLLDSVMDFVISEFKDWLMSLEGMEWLSDLGYVKSNKVEYQGYDFCPQCSGILLRSDHNICECCGREVCSHCSNIVDRDVGIRWCDNCVSIHRLTNFQ